MDRLARRAGFVSSGRVNSEVVFRLRLVHRPKAEVRLAELNAQNRPLRLSSNGFQRRPLPVKLPFEFE
jgi:hypothetical protein